VTPPAPDALPPLELVTAKFRLFYEPLEFDCEVLQTVRCRVAVTLHHPTGWFRYEADDIWLCLDDDLEEFTHQLEGVIAGLEEAAVLSCMSREVTLRLARAGSGVEATLAIREYQGSHADTVLEGSFLIEAEYLGRWRADVDRWLRETLEPSAGQR